MEFSPRDSREGSPGPGMTSGSSERTSARAAEATVASERSAEVCLYDNMVTVVRRLSVVDLTVTEAVAAMDCRTASSYTFRRSSCSGNLPTEPSHQLPYAGV